MKETMIAMLCFYICIHSFHAQLSNEITGSILDADTKLPVPNVSITILNTSIFRTSDVNGVFTIKNIPVGKQVLEISLDNYETRRIYITIEKNKSIDLGALLLVKDFSSEEKTSGLISLTEDDLNDDDIGAENTSGILQASRDVFQKRAAFDYSQAFFRVRGYGSENAEVLINGLSMNRLFNGRPQWSNWGGLNDVTRNQELTTGLAASNNTFGGIMGSTNIIMRPSKFRSGLRISGSYSNRTYGGRGMATYSSGLQKNKLAYTFSASRRWANEGFIKGTLYDAYSVFGAIEYKFNSKSSINLAAFFAPNKRGGAAAITERVFNELGRAYNPHWGFQDGDKRNSRIRSIEEPIFLFSHFYEGEKTSVTTTISYQIGQQGRSRLDFANAPNPNPNYWRYLPNISENPQINWGNFYDANQNTLNVENPGAARYLLYEDRTDDVLLAANTIINTKIADFLSFDIGGTYKSLTSENFAIPLDLLGAEYYEDVNQFTIINGQPARNDVNGKINKGLDDHIKYDYTILSDQVNGFAQLRFNFSKIDFFLGGSYTNTGYQRVGNFLNESYPDNSFGKSEELIFTDFGLKGGITYKITGRHLASVNAAYSTKAPTIRNSFINSRENNQIVSDLRSEKITAAEASYFFRSPLLKYRFTGYYTEFKEGTDINFVFAQSGSGTDFFQEVVTNIDRRHFGVELGLEFQASPTTKITAVAAYGKHTYTDNANISVNFDTAGLNDDLINTIGFKELGETNIEGLRVANGPQQAYSLGIEYRNPKYWWVGATANYLLNSYVDVSTITRTGDFFINPDDPLGLPFEDIDMELASKLLAQEKFEPFYLLNLTGGKSWRIKNNYLSLFLSVNNAFETTFRTGGYEQSRTANYGDLLQDTANGNNQRSFGNKYWFGFGRTYFINIAYNF